MDKQIFNQTLTLEWIHVEDKQPLDDFLERNSDFMGGSRGGIQTTIFALVVDPDNPHEDPAVVMLEFIYTNKDGGSWHYLGGEEYPKYWRERILYWAEIPEYDKGSILNGI